jgi:hypothetical protein
MEQWIRGHFREAQRIVVILEKPAVLVVKMAKISWPLDLHPPCCCDVSAGAIGQLPHIGRQQAPCSFASAHDAVMQCKACKQAPPMRCGHGMACQVDEHATATTELFLF